MADMISHTLVGYILKKSSSSQKGMAAFLVGCCLPDFLMHGPGVGIQIFCDLFSREQPYLLLMGLGVLHDPLGYTIFCFWISRFLKGPENQKLLFQNLLLGGALHYLLDIIQIHLNPGYLPLFPLANSPFEVGLIGSETSLYFVPLWILLSLLLWWRSSDHEKD